MAKTVRRMSRLLITASGGPFRGKKTADLKKVHGTGCPETSELGDGT